MESIREDNAVWLLAYGFHGKKVIAYLHDVIVYTPGGPDEPIH